jgi:hypothetical protein
MTDLRPLFSPGKIACVLLPTLCFGQALAQNDAERSRGGHGVQSK